MKDMKFAEDSLPIHINVTQSSILSGGRDLRVGVASSNSGGARFPVLVQTGPGACPASQTESAGLSHRA
jgi:hypothetical protein